MLPSPTHLCCDNRAAGARGPPPQVLSPPGPSRQQPQHPPSYRSPVAPVTLPPPRLRPMPGGPVPGLGGGEYTPRGRRDQPGSQADRPRCLYVHSLVQQAHVVHGICCLFTGAELKVMSSLLCVVAGLQTCVYYSHMSKLIAGMFWLQRCFCLLGVENIALL